jgi:streptogramin lyase
MALISQWTKLGDLIQTINIAATNTMPSGITTDRKFLWLTDVQFNQIEQYDKFGNLIRSFVLPVVGVELADITTDRKFLWIVDWEHSQVHQLDKSGNLIQSWATVNIPLGITTDRKFIWTVEYDIWVDTWIRQYTKSGILIQTISIGAFVGQLGSSGITTDRKFLWVTDYFNFQVHQFDKLGNHIQSWPCAPGGEAPYGITTDRKFLWVTSIAP